MNETVKNIKLTYEVAENPKSERFTSNHETYKCMLKYNRKRYSFEYQCNPKYEKPNLNSILECLTSDMHLYESSRDLGDFAIELGYTMEEAEKPYKSCAETSKAFHRMFSESEIENIMDYLFYET